MVKTVTTKINDELYDEAVIKAENIGLNRSQLVRYAIAIVCGYSAHNAKIMALISPDKPFSEVRESGS